MKKIVKVKNLTVSFPSAQNKKRLVKVIRGIDFEIEQNKIIGFIGESGSGKSVTAKSLLGINNNAKTQAEVIDVKGVSLLNDKHNLTNSKKIWKNIRGKKVAYIPQDSLTSLNPTKRIGKQITEVLKIHSQVEKTEKQRKAKAVKLLEHFGIKDAVSKLNAYPHQFSGGMRQRVVIAMMVACNPDIIIADEPTTALDPTIQASVMALFQDIVKTTKTSIILISHDIAVIAKVCDYLYIFYAGAVVEKGTKKDIFTNPQHPYTWSLLSAIPDTLINKPGSKLFSIPGQPPNFDNLPKGDPFSIRNPFAMKIDFKQEAPLFKVSDTHYAATWLLHPHAKKAEKPRPVLELIKITSKEFEHGQAK